VATSNTKKSKKRPLNIRERKFIKALGEGLSPADAMRKAGYAENTAIYKSGEKLRKVKEPVQKIMERLGLTDEYLLTGFKEGTKATKVISAIVIAKNGEGMKDADSMTKDFVDVDDFAVRHKYYETLAKISGLLKDKIDVSGDIVVEVVRFANGAKD